MRSIIPLIILAIFISSGCIRNQKVSDQEAKGESPRFWASSPDSATLFGAGPISSEAPEFATSFSPDYTEVYFNRTSENRNFIHIMVSKWDGNKWTEAEPIWFSDTLYKDVDPFVSPDGQRLYFSTDRDPSGTTAEKFDIWFSKRKGDSWESPERLEDGLNTPYYEVFTTIANSGNMYFSAENEDGGRDIFVSRYENGKFGEREKLSFPGTESLRLGNPCIDPEEQYILLVTSDPIGGADIFRSDKQEDGNWGPLKNLGNAVNSNYTEFAPHITADGKYLFFSSERPGVIHHTAPGRPPGDIYVVQLKK